MSSPESESAFAMHTQQLVEQEKTTEVMLLAPEGLGFGNGTISAKEQLKNSETTGLTHEAFKAGIDIIMNDPRVFVDVDEDDDGCGDGRPAAVIYQMVPVVPESNEVQLYRQTFNKSRRRAKVFGGGLIAAASMMRTAVWGEVKKDDSVLTDRKKTVAILKSLKIRFGAHTDNHAHGDNCGCGAIDKYAQIFEDVLEFEDKIRGVVQLYIADAWDNKWENDADIVFNSYRDQLQSSNFLKDVNGSKTMKLIEESGAVIKQLADDHLEDYVVLNDEEGTTFDQRVFDDIMRERGIEGTAQAFVADMWRGRMYADAVAKYVSEQNDLHLDYDTVYRRSLIDFIARTTCGPSATLTDGTQPAFLRRTRSAIAA